MTKLLSKMSSMRCLLCAAGCTDASLKMYPGMGHSSCPQASPAGSSAGCHGARRSTLVPMQHGPLGFRADSNGLKGWRSIVDRSCGETLCWLNVRFSLRYGWVLQELRDVRAFLLRVLPDEQPSK